MSGHRIGVDIGGTFTDIVLVGPEGEIHTKKVLSTPDDYGRAVVEGTRDVCAEHGVSTAAIERVVHGTTIVTNACIEKTGAKVGLITTKGFRDVLEIGRGRLPVVLDLTWSKPPPLVPRHLRLEVDERVNALGEVLRPLDTESASLAIDRLLEAGVDSIAVCLFNAPANPVHERKLAQLVCDRAPEVPLSVSTEVMPMIGEYERSSETALNAYVMPLVSRYLRGLRQNLKDAGIDAPLYIMQSSGGMTTPENSIRRPIEIIECGPAAGVVGAAFLARHQDVSNLITFDMGGTTAKASIVEAGRYTRSSEYEVGGGVNQAGRMLKGGGYVVRVPSIDIAEIGAGGGSLLRIDQGRALHIGPQSAGAIPGPVCYDQGGEEPTLTDADLVLGYINPDHLCGGAFPLNAEKAFAAIAERVAGPLGKDPFEAALGAHVLTNAQMMRAIRAVSSERGRDPRRFRLYAFGGSGPVHAAGVAAGLGIETVIVPPVPGVFSAYGLLAGDFERHYTRSFARAWDEAVLEELNRLLDAMADEARSTIAVWAGTSAAEPCLQPAIDLQYAGQGSALSIPAPSGALQRADISALALAFADEHERTYGHRLAGHPIRATALRLAATLPSNGPAASGHAARPARRRGQPRTTRTAYWGKGTGAVETPVFDLGDIGTTPTAGPALVDCDDTTIVVPPGATIALGEWGNAVIRLGGKETRHG